MKEIQNLLKAFNNKFVAHPWHGVSIGEKTPDIVNAFIEIVPSDAIKYEVDKDSGFIMIDRPQKFSNHMPCMYGFVPQTYCDTRIAEFCKEKTGKTGIVGDQDPLDICVLTERQVNRGNIFMEAIPIGGFRMIDGGEADDKIIAVLKGDQAYGDIKDISDMPKMVIDRVKHFFLTYKDLEGNSKNVEITHVYGADEAKEVINRSFDDYTAKFGNADQALAEALMQALGVKA
ncbi:MAG: inorganic pyrophosphatase [Crocinitomicaceae bacterium]|nr:inorganic pyrophosphatase [Crocinitomicaceae bacterium]